MEKLPLVEVEQRNRDLFGHRYDARIVQYQLLMMQKVKEGAHGDELGDHVEVRVDLLVEADAHVEDNVGMAQLVEHLDLLDEVFQCLLGHVSFAELLDSDKRPHPTRLKDITVATSPNEVRLGVDLQLLEVDVEIEAIFFKCPDQTGLLAESHGGFRIDQTIGRGHWGLSAEKGG